MFNCKFLPNDVHFYYFSGAHYIKHRQKHKRTATDILPLTLHQDSCCTSSSQTDSAAQRSQSAPTSSTCSKTPHTLLLFVSWPEDEKNKTLLKSGENLLQIYMCTSLCLCQRGISSNHEIRLTLCFCMRWKFLSYICSACSKFLHSSSDHGGDFSEMNPGIHQAQFKQPMCKQGRPTKKIHNTGLNLTSPPNWLLQGLTGLDGSY